MIILVRTGPEQREWARNEEAPVLDDTIRDLKTYARVLHRRALARDAQAMLDLHALPEFARANDDELVQLLQRRHCLKLVARRLGFQDWKHALDILSGAQSDDFGTLLYPATCSGHWNIWSAAYAEAAEIRAAHGGYLLAYKRQFLIVDRDYVDSMGLDPDDPDWNRIGRDWVRPKQADARARLYRKLVQNFMVLNALHARVEH